MRVRSFLALVAVMALVLTACTSGASPSPSAASPAASAPAASTPAQSAAASAPASQSSAEAATVRLQLQWVPQAQFAGYFAADQQGYYTDENLTVQFVPGGPDVIPQAVGSQPDGPEFTISWVPKVLEAREGGSDLVDIAQIFQRSGTLSVSWKDSGIDDPCKFAGKKVGVWDFGNEFEVTAGALTCGVTPGLENNGDPSKQFQKVIQPFDMTLLLSRQIDVAEAMIYNEYAQVLEAQNQETGQLYKPEDLNIINWNDDPYRTAMLQDAIFARKAWLSQGSNRDVAVRFVRASLKGWIYCRDHPDDCVKYTTDAGSQLGAGHQAWMMNEVNGLIWPSPVGVGVVDPVFYGQTVRVAKNAGVIKQDPTPDAYDANIAKEALESLGDLDTKGEKFQKANVEVTPGGN
ncbi:MAG: ABC transporter substrate-binding protein [Chloroflexota bacterium]